MFRLRRYFGSFGGIYIPELFIPILQELEETFIRAKRDREFQRELRFLQREYAGRPTPLTPARNLSKLIGAKIYLKREDLAHTGAHKINNTLGQALLAKYMGKKRIIAETGAGQHGVATATAAAYLGMECEVFMGAEDVKRQKLNVLRMELLGAKVIPVEKGSGTLKDAINEALRDWAENVKTTYYLLGSVVGPHPYPTIVKYFQSVIGKETKQQIHRYEGRNPNYIIACVGGGSNAMGIFSAFLKNKETKLIGVEAGGTGLNQLHSATLNLGEPGYLHGARSLLLQDKWGQVKKVHSIAPGLDYPGVGPELAHLVSIGRVKAVYATDKEVIDAVKILSETEGIIPALESAHAVAYLVKNKDIFKEDDIIVINISGRGDKDMEIIMEALKNE